MAPKQKKETQKQHNEEGDVEMEEEEEEEAPVEAPPKKEKKKKAKGKKKQITPEDRVDVVIKHVDGAQSRWNVEYQEKGKRTMRGFYYGKLRTCEVALEAAKKFAYEECTGYTGEVLGGPKEGGEKQKAPKSPPKERAKRKAQQKEEDKSESEKVESEGEGEEEEEAPKPAPKKRTKKAPKEESEGEGEAPAPQKKRRTVGKSRKAAIKAIEFEDGVSIKKVGGEQGRFNVEWRNLETGKRESKSFQIHAFGKEAALEKAKNHAAEVRASGEQDPAYVPLSEGGQKKRKAEAEEQTSPKRRGRGRQEEDDE